MNKTEVQIIISIPTYLSPRSLSIRIRTGL